jgi:hypothetical protein
MPHAHHIAAVVTTAALCAPAVAGAQGDEERAPLELVVLDVAKKGGSSATKAIRRELGALDSVNLGDAGAIEDELGSFDLDRASLRKSSVRRKYSNRIYRLMRANGIEGLLLIDVYSKGRKVQLVVIGPDGEELTDVKKSTRRGKLSRDAARGMLRSAFKPLGPAVLDYRAELAERADDTPIDAALDPKDGGGAEVEDEVERPTPRTTLSPGVNIALGGFVGRRGLEVLEGTDPNDFRLVHASPFVGAGARVDAIAWAEGESAVGVTLTGAYAPFTTLSANPDGETTRELASSVVRVGGQVSYFRSLGARAIVDVWGGGEFTSLTIASNEFYTGNQYGYARAGLGFEWKFNTDASARAHAGVLPTFSASNSGEAFGVSPFSLGYEAGLALALALSENIFFRLDYTFQLYSPEYPEPLPPITAATSSTDIFNTGNVLIGFSL